MSREEQDMTAHELYLAMTADQPGKVWGFQLPDGRWAQIDNMRMQRSINGVIEITAFVDPEQPLRVLTMEDE